MIDLSSYDVIFFDYNGTIIDDVDLCLNILNTMLVSKNHAPITKEFYLKIFTFPIINYYQKAGFNFPEDDFPSLAKFYTRTYLDNYKKLKINPGVEPLLINLINQGKKLYIISASQKDLLEEQLQYFNLKKYFLGISALDNSHGYSKIDNAINFIKENNIDLTKALLIGDTLHDEQTSKELAIPCLLYAKGHQDKEILKQGSSLVFDSFFDLINK